LAYTALVPSRDDWQRRLGPLYGGAVALVHSTPWRWPTEVGDDPRARLALDCALDRLEVADDGLLASAFEVEDRAYQRGCGHKRGSND